MKKKNRAKKKLSKKITEKKTEKKVVFSGRPKWVPAKKFLKATNPPSGRPNFRIFKLYRGLARRYPQ